MSNRVRQLPPEVANKIAAGEVIERPANAVKELIENALDAGARRVQIEIEEGGKKLIRVRDDGSGMSAGDAVLSLQRHATSKISDAEDLWKVKTLGFRGEAMPSLAAVSRMEITTREHDADEGTRLVIEGGEILDVSNVGCAPGTEVVVRSLFFNTPARFKFLKSDAAEAARISELVGHLALANPEVAFVLKNNGTETQRVEAGGDGLNALVSVWGRDSARQMLPISSGEDFGAIKVRGFAGRPQLTRANRSSQLFFVNGRVVKSRALQHAFGAAYEGLIHGRERFPVGVIFLDVAPGSVDVNVHPTKSEVRFAREGEAHHALRVAVRDTLVGAQLAPSWGLNGEEVSARSDGNFYGPFGSQNPSPNNDSRPIPTPNYARFSPQDSPEVAFRQPLNLPDDSDRFRAHLNDIRDGKSGFEPQLFPQNEPAPKLKLRPLAQISNCAYILCEGDDGLYIVNPHRAHERILADRALEKAAREKVEAQRLVIPYTLECGPRALAAVEENAKLLLELGFEVESFGGNSLLVRAVPVLVANGDYERAFGDLLDELVSGHAGRDLEERRRTLLVMLSCKNAIKAGDPLAPAQMQGLVDDLVELPNPSICPHGQPILIKISTFELHKKFEREYAMR